MNFSIGLGNFQDDIGKIGWTSLRGVIKLPVALG
jgi:hypothetical protein